MSAHAHALVAQVQVVRVECLAARAALAVWLEAADVRGLLALQQRLVGAQDEGRTQQGFWEEERKACLRRRDRGKGGSEGAWAKLAVR